ncbi:MAG: hypothetical protein KAU26_04795 [Methylococcales bacterium]|nr:hypothetical protein [Methylococcales bacterium]
MLTYDEYISFLLDSFKEYLDCRDNFKLEPRCKPLTYEFDFIANKQWRSHFCGEHLVRDEIRELTNCINEWSEFLRNWHPWMMVLKTKDQTEALDLQFEFINTIAHTCLLQPSSIRDTITSIATSTLHQVRLSMDSSYPDFLEGDPTPYKKAKYLNRKQKERRLAKLSEIWEESLLFIESLRKINTDNYIKKTCDYRNLANHTIAPRFNVGHTRLVTRSVIPSTKMERQKNGTYAEKLIPNKMSVTYGFGGTAPLNLEEMRILNLEQFELTRTCYLKYKHLLKSAVSLMKPYPELSN